MGKGEHKKNSSEKSIRNLRIAIWILVAIAFALGIFIFIKNAPPPNGKYDAFAKCIAHTSTTFFGAFWCPHCHDQKNEFGDAAKYLPYVECSPPDAIGENQICTQNKISEYPTWQFPDGSRASGMQTLQTLSEKTGCPLPTGTS
jgi:hypothetical protein